MIRSNFEDSLRDSRLTKYNPTSYENLLKAMFGNQVYLVSRFMYLEEGEIDGDIIVKSSYFIGGTSPTPITLLIEESSTEFKEGYCINYIDYYIEYYDEHGEFTRELYGESIISFANLYERVRELLLQERRRTKRNRHVAKNDIDNEEDKQND